MASHSRSNEIFEHNRRFIPGGISSLNRLTEPNIAFVRGEGSRIWDADGNEYIDYHGAFAPQFLGFSHPRITAAVRAVLDDQVDLFGAGPSELEGRLAELICSNIDWVEKAAVFNTGSEGTAQAIRLARAATSRDHVILMQGGYNGWHNDVACNLMTPLEVLGERVSPGEYPFLPISAGIPKAHQELIHNVNFNDLASVRHVAERYPVAAVLLEPLLQNVGVIRPQPGYLQGLRALADEFGFLLVFDEVKTGFRHAVGGYAEISGVAPDLAVYGKAIASGYPIGVLAGRSRWMDYFAHENVAKRVLLAGTYNAHPIPTAAAVATIECLLEDNRQVHAQVESRGAELERGLRTLFEGKGIETVIVRQGSAFCIYLMDHEPVDWHDLASSHDNALDEKLRRALIERGVFVFPLARKQWSVSAAHTADDIALTLEKAKAVLEN